MKKLQSSFTTPEQSKRLLELGVPADSADCFYYSTNQERRIIMETIGHECYVSLEVAKLLKQAGFDWRSNAIYGSVGGEFNFYYGISKLANKNNDEYSAPTLDVAQRWLREVKAIHICVKPNEASANCKYFVTVIVNDTKWGNIQDDNRKTIMFDTYEEALEAGIKKALEIILEKGE